MIQQKNENEVWTIYRAAQENNMPFHEFIKLPKTQFKINLFGSLIWNRTIEKAQEKMNASD